MKNEYLFIPLLLFAALSIAPMELARGEEPKPAVKPRYATGTEVDAAPVVEPGTPVGKLALPFTFYRQPEMPFIIELSEQITPLFPRLRSGHPLFQRPSPQKQFPSNYTQAAKSMGMTTREVMMAMKEADMSQDRSQLALQGFTNIKALPAETMRKVREIDPKRYEEVIQATRRQASRVDLRDR
jgi:hypothetical protein